jgi:hypothetical protein
LLFGVEIGIDSLDERRAVVDGGLVLVLVSLEEDLCWERELRCWIVWRMSLMNWVFVVLDCLMEDIDCLCLREYTALVEIALLLVLVLLLLLLCV